jgi:hypothetical protein
MKYEKIYIKSVDDLPKEDGIYFTQITDTCKGSFHFNPDDKDDIDFFMGDVEFYLLPIEDPTDEEIIDYALEYVSHKSLKPANRGLIKDALIIGAKAMRDGLIKNKSKI